MSKYMESSSIYKTKKQEFIIKNINILKELKPNWNSYGAVQIENESMVAAISLLERILNPGISFPAIVPTSNGGVLLEWHEGGIDLEIDCKSPFYYASEYQRGKHEESNQFTRVGNIAKYIQEKFGLDN